MHSIYAFYSVCLLIFIIQPENVYNKAWDRVNLPDSHLPFYFKANSKMRKKCEKDDLCPFKQHLNSTSCYGYEKNCQSNEIVIEGSCPGESRGWVFLILIYLIHNENDFVFYEGIYKRRTVKKILGLCRFWLC